LTDLRHSFTHKQLNSSIFALLAVIIRYCSQIPIQPEYVKILIHLIQSDVIDNNSNIPIPQQMTSFQLLRAILYRHIVTTEIYDLMPRIGELMLIHTSDSKEIPNASKEAFIHFIIHYPLGEKRLMTHFQFLVMNLEFSQRAGRRIILDCVYVLLWKIPEQVIEQIFDLMLFPLIIRCVSDEDSVCRQMASKTIKLLISRANDFLHNRTIEFCLQWLNQGDTGPKVQMLKMAALQISRIVLELQNEKNVTLFDTKSLKELLTILIRMTEKHTVSIIQFEKEKQKQKVQNIKTENDTISEHNDGDEQNHSIQVNETDNTTALSNQAKKMPDVETLTKNWYLLYQILLCLESCLTNSLFVKTTISLLTTPLNAKRMFECFCVCLTHPHTWIRYCTTRIWNCYLATIDLTVNKNYIQSSLFKQSENQLTLLKRSYCQLMSQNLSAEYCENVFKNIVWLLEAIEKNGKFWSTQNQSALDKRDDDMNDNSNGDHDDENLKINHEDQDENIYSNLKAIPKLVKPIQCQCSNIALNWFFHRISYRLRKVDSLISRQIDIRQREILLRLEAHLVISLDQTTLESQLINLINPLYRLTSTSDPQTIRTGLCETASQVLELIRQTIRNKQLFNSVYNYCQNTVDQSRNRRKSEQKQLLIKDPQKAAKIKLTHQIKKKMKRKRDKIEENNESSNQIKATLTDTSRSQTKKRRRRK